MNLPAPISIWPVILRGRKNWERFQQAVEQAVHSTSIQPTDHYDAAELLLITKRNLPLAAQQMRAYIQGGHTEEAAPLFRAHFLLGEILLKSGDAGQAAAEFRAALALASSYRPAAESLRRLGNARAAPLAEDYDRTMTRTSSPKLRTPLSPSVADGVTDTAAADHGRAAPPCPVRRVPSGHRTGPQAQWRHALRPPPTAHAPPRATAPNATPTSRPWSSAPASVTTLERLSPSPDKLPRSSTSPTTRPC